MSKPRCKPGDMAFITRGLNIGKIVHVIRAYRSGEILNSSTWSGEPGSSCFLWVVQSAGKPLKTINTNDGSNAPDQMVLAMSDSILMPIRPSNGADEVLRLTGKPQQRNGVAA